MSTEMERVEQKLENIDKKLDKIAEAQSATAIEVAVLKSSFTTHVAADAEAHKKIESLSGRFYYFSGAVAAVLIAIELALKFWK